MLQVKDHFVRKPHRYFRCLLPVVALLAGCGEKIPTAPIRGQVTLAGRPVGPGVVILQPDNPATELELPITTMNFTGDGQFTGRAPVGKHQVIITSQEGEPGQEIADSRLTPPKIPLYYADPAVSQMTAQVTDGDNELRFDLKPSSPR